MKERKKIGNRENYKNSQIKFRSEFRAKKFPLFTFPILSKNRLYFVESFCKHGDLYVEPYYFNYVYTKLDNNYSFYCDECKKEHLNQIILSKNEIEISRELLKNLYLRGGAALKENHICKYCHTLFKCINDNCNLDISWIEKTFLFKENLKTIPKCTIEGCPDNVHFSSSNGRYTYFCEKHSHRFSSKGEIELFNYIANFYPDTKKLRISGSEFDVYIPSLNMAFEFNGLYWHSDAYKKKSYHYDKHKLANKNGINLINIWEDDWNYKKDIVKSIIKNKLKLNETKIYARNCVIKEVLPEDAKIFLNENHLQGAVAANIKLGLYYNDILVSLMTFGKRKISNKSQFELLRFCNKLNFSIIGSASKLFKHFLNNYQYNTIISYANLDISNGNIYKILGFKEVGYTGINFWWSDNINRYSRNKFMKYKINKEDKYNTANDIMINKGYHKIYGTGNLKFEFNKD